MSSTLIIKRKDFKEDQTEGILLVLNDDCIDFSCRTLELPWLNNQRNISCIPEGIYPARKRFTNQFKHHIEILNVPNRSGILIHVANYSRQLRGCIAPGMFLSDIDKDGLQDVVHSRVALNGMLAVLPEEFKVVII